MQIAIFNIELTDIYYLTAGFMFACVIFGFHVAQLKKELKQLKRQYEKKSIGADDSGLKIKTLENKIKTLETALKKNLESK